MRENKNPTPYQIEKIKILMGARDLQRSAQAEKDLTVKALEFMNHQVWVTRALADAKELRKYHQELGDAFQEEANKTGICQKCCGERKKPIPPSSHYLPGSGFDGPLPNREDCSDCGGTGWKDHGPTTDFTRNDIDKLVKQLDPPR